MIIYYSALIGSQTEHSISHILYDELVRLAGIKAQYAHIKVNLEEAELRDALEAFRRLKFVGVNVTLPHKLSIMPLLDKCDDIVGELGAVNTVRLGDKTHGFNTDWEGIYTPLHKLGATPVKATIFGSGGAARAAIYATKQLGVKNIVVLYRDNPISQKTKDLLDRSEELGIALYGYEQLEENVQTADLIINATSAGMVGKDSSPFELHRLKGMNLTDKVFLDAVFNPVNTPLLAYMHERNVRTVDGLWMMIYQGVAALSIWLDLDIKIADQDLVRIHKRLEESIIHA